MSGLLISSLQNPLVKQILELQSKSRERTKQGLFVVEGLNEIRLCVAAGFQIDQLIFCSKNIAEEALIRKVKITSQKLRFTEVTEAVFAKMAYRDDVENAIAIVCTSSMSLADLKLDKNAVVLVAEGIEKPGNLGAILRSADAMGVAAVILANPKCDMYNPNVIRGSVGSVFAIPVITSSNEHTLDFLNKNEIAVFTTFMEAAELAWSIEFRKASAIVVGTESTGLTDFWKDIGAKNINVPMFGKVDSLNVSVAVSIMLYEAARQLRSKK